MDSTVKKRPKTMAELLPGLGGLLSEEAMKTITLTATKKPRPNIANTRTSEKVLKPLTIAEMFTDFRSLQSKSPRQNAQSTASAKRWNSSCKLENKTVSHTANGQLKRNSVRKVLNFQPPKPKVAKPVYSRMTMMSQETPKFVKPEVKEKKSLYLQARSTVRISGICNIPETPVVINKPTMNRMTLANKENFSHQANVYKKDISTPKSNKDNNSNQPVKRAVATPKLSLRKKVLVSAIPDTPLSNESWKSSCDASFLQNEQDIDFIENKAKALADEQTLDNIAEVSPPVSTPFTEYRNVKDFFNNTHNVTENTYHDNTIMSFDNTLSKDNGKREESVIVSLCDMLKKATVSTQKHSTEDDLIEMQRQTENNIRMIENSIQTLNSIRESQIRSLQYVNKLIKEKNQRVSESENENTVIDTKSTPKIDRLNLESIHKPSSVIKSIKKSPSYKIPKKYTGMRKKVFCKSMPDIPGSATPQKDMGLRARSMYMKLKERNIYLNTPVLKPRCTADVPDTPALTSHNLQQQLDKLYDES